MAAGSWKENASKERQSLDSDAINTDQAPKRFRAKWKPVRVKKTRQIKNLEPRFDSIETEKALASDALDRGLPLVRRREVSLPHPP